MTMSNRTTIAVRTAAAKQNSLYSANPVIISTTTYRENRGDFNDFEKNWRKS